MLGLDIQYAQKVLVYLTDWDPDREVTILRRWRHGRPMWGGRGHWAVRLAAKKSPTMVTRQPMRGPQVWWQTQLPKQPQSPQPSSSEICCDLWVLGVGFVELLLPETLNLKGFDKKQMKGFVRVSDEKRVSKATTVKMLPCSGLGTWGLRRCDFNLWSSYFQDWDGGHRVIFLILF